MTANKYYIPSFIGGKIKGASMSVHNLGSSGTTVDFTKKHGLFYVYQGQEFPLITGDNTTLTANSPTSEHTVSRELDPPFIPDGDIKLMISTGGLINCTIHVNIVWEVE